MDSLQTLIGVVGLSAASAEVSVSSANILASAREVQDAATSMASAVEELAASIGEIGNSAQRSAQAVDESSRLTNAGMQELTGLRGQIAETGTLFESVAVKTRDLQGVVSSLGQVVDLIAKIAGQTNLLALNATIEAARAGEHGKGFAVVASEVKSLSRQTAEATETIRGQIKNLNDSFASVLDTVSKSQSTMEKVVGSAEKVGSDFQTISENSASISHQANELTGIIEQQKIAVNLLAENMDVVKEKGAQNLGSVEKLADQADASVKLIEDMRSQLATEDIPHKILYLAKADHVLWKKKLLDMAVGRVSLKSSELADHTMCRLGKWYYQQADEATKRMAAFRELEGAHKKVHAAGIEAAKCFEAQKLKEGMNYYRELEEASHDVLRCLNSMIEEATRGA
ncbi:MAG: CZB domain-containing protein [Alphaproteobacteria bacterium]|nr:CZB domain-containing protein [Alphaproteobacteria bacterium]